MRILHTSDWHIGKRLMGRERLDEQSAVLDEIIGICDKEQIDLVLIAGDIFDTYTPSAEAEELFYSKIKLVAGLDRAVLIISGNHDDGVRLSAASPLAEETGIYIVGNARKALKIGGERRVRPVQSGKGNAVFEKENGERVFVSMLPYPNEARFKEEKSELAYLEQMQKWMQESEEGREAGLPSVFMSHLFVLGGQSSESEREIDLGGARAIPCDILPKSDYIALGHLHKKQKMGAGHCYYSGSPLQYSFDESPTKSVRVFDLTTNGVENLKEVPLTSGKKLIRLEATDVESGVALLALYPDCLIELTLHLSEPLTSAESTLLSSSKNLISLLTDVKTDGEIQFESRKNLSMEKLFVEFYRSQYGVEPEDELKNLFLQVMIDLEHS